MPTTAEKIIVEASRKKISMRPHSRRSDARTPRAAPKASHQTLRFLPHTENSSTQKNQTESPLARIIVKRKVRTLSGIAAITVMTQRRVPGRMRLLPNRARHAQKLSVQRARGHARSPTSSTPTGRSPAVLRRLKSAGARDRQDRNYRHRRDVVVHPPPLPRTIHRAAV